jgi:hypothetical protein
MGTDRRWLYPNLVSQSVGPESAVQDFRQTVRALTDSVQRNLDAVTDKANVDETLTLVTEKPQSFALMVNNIPNTVLESIENGVRLARFRDAIPGRESPGCPRFQPDRGHLTALRPHRSGHDHQGPKRDGFHAW